MKLRSGQRNLVLQQFKLFVEKNAGNDAAGLISAFLNTRNAKSEELLKKIVFEDARIRILFESLANASNKSENFQKRQFLSIMRKAGFSRNEVKNFGFSVSSTSWKTAGKH